MALVCKSCEAAALIFYLSPFYVAAPQLHNPGRCTSQGLRPGLPSSAAPQPIASPAPIYYFRLTETSAPAGKPFVATAICYLLPDSALVFGQGIIESQVAVIQRD